MYGLQRDSSSKPTEDANAEQRQSNSPSDRKISPNKDLEAVTEKRPKDLATTQSFDLTSRLGDLSKRRV